MLGSVVYINQLMGAVSTLELVETLFFAFFNLLY